MGSPASATATAPPQSGLFIQMKQHYQIENGFGYNYMGLSLLGTAANMVEPPCHYNHYRAQATGIIFVLWKAATNT